MSDTTATNHVKTETFYKDFCRGCGECRFMRDADADYCYVCIYNMQNDKPLYKGDPMALYDQK